MDKVIVGYAVWAILPPPIPGLKGSEKQVGSSHVSEDDALHALERTKVPNAKLEVRPVYGLSEKEKAMNAEVEKLREGVAKAQKQAKAAATREITALAKAIILSGQKLEECEVLKALSDDIRTAVIAKIAELSLPENRAKMERESSSERSRFKPLTLSGLAMAIGVERLDEVAPFPKRPDVWNGLPQYHADLVTFKKALERHYEPLKGANLNDTVLNRNVYRNAIRRLETEMETVNHHIGDYQNHSMPEWPLNLAKDPASSNTEKDKGKPNEKATIALDVPAGMDVEALAENAKKAAHRTKVNSVRRAEIGPGFAEQFAAKPVVKSKDYSGGQLSWGMKCNNFVATFSKG